MSEAGVPSASEGIRVPDTQGRSGGLGRRGALTPSPDLPPHLLCHGDASVARALVASHSGRAPRAGWSRRAVRRMALRAHHAEPAELSPQRSFNAFPPRARTARANVPP